MSIDDRFNELRNKYAGKIKEEDFIKCGSPLGEYELHCDKDTLQSILNNQEIVEKLQPHLEEYIINLNGLKEKITDWRKQTHERISFTRLDYMVRWGEKLKSILEDN